MTTVRKSSPWADHARAVQRLGQAGTGKDSLVKWTTHVGGTSPQDVSGFVPTDEDARGLLVDEEFVPFGYCFGNKRKT